MSKHLRVIETGEVGRVNQSNEDSVQLSLPSDAMEPPKFVWFLKHLVEEVLLPIAEKIVPGIKPVADKVQPIVDTVIAAVTKPKPAVKKVTAKKVAAPAPTKAATKKETVKK